MILFNDLKQHLSAKNKSAFEQYVALLTRAETPHDDDAEALAELMSKLNISLEQATADAGTIRKVRRLSPHILEQSQRQQRKHDADKALLAHEAETERLIQKVKDDRHSALAVLKDKQNIATNDVANSTAARSDMQHIIFDYKRLYPSDPLKWFGE